MKVSNNKDYQKCWNYEGSPWKTESAWLAYLRGTLRKAWSRHPAKIAKLNRDRVKIENPSPTSAKRFPQVWGARCECCGGIFPLSSGKKEKSGKDTIVVDHAKPAGAFTNVKEFQGFFERLLCISPDDLRLLCTTCNATYSLADKLGVSFEEAHANRQAIQIIKDKRDKHWLLENNILPAKAQKNRREQIVAEIMRQKGN